MSTGKHKRIREKRKDVKVIFERLLSGKFREWPDFEIVQRTVAQIPWRSNITLLDKLKEPETSAVT